MPAYKDLPASSGVFDSSYRICGGCSNLRPSKTLQRAFNIFIQRNGKVELKVYYRHNFHVVDFISREVRLAGNCFSPWNFIRLKESHVYIGLHCTKSKRKRATLGHKSPRHIFFR